MADKKITLLPSELVERIDQNRGDASRADFITALLENALEENSVKENTSAFITRQELETFKHDVRSLLKNFVDFFIAYGLEIGSTSKKEEFDLLEQKLKEVTEPPVRTSRVSSK